MYGGYHGRNRGWEKPLYQQTGWQKDYSGGRLSSRLCVFDFIFIERITPTKNF